MMRNMATKPAKTPFVTLFMRKKVGIVDKAQTNETPTFTPKEMSPTRREKIEYERRITVNKLSS